MSDLTERLRATHREMPHRYPGGLTEGDLFGWKCAACGEWVNELDDTSQCTVDWRGPYLTHEAADALEAAEAKLAAIDALHHRVIHRTTKQTICRYCRECWPCPTYRILHPEGRP